MFDATITVRPTSALDIRVEAWPHGYLSGHPAPKGERGVSRCLYATQSEPAEPLSNYDVRNTCRRWLRRRCRLSPPPVPGLLSVYEYIVRKASDGRRGGVRLRTLMARLGLFPRRAADPRSHGAYRRTNHAGGRRWSWGLFWSFPGWDRRVMWRELRLDAYRAIIGDNGSWEEGVLLVCPVSGVFSGM